MRCPMTNSERPFDADGRDEYDQAAKVANEAITEAVARYLHEAMLEKEERQEGSERRLNVRLSISHPRDR